MIEEIGLRTARRLIDYSGGRDGGGVIWQTQIEGAVALHNILIRESVAYLADEVGMGKTYIALGVASLFRHFHPGWRVLYIAPRENLQQKWRKELANFTAVNWLLVDNAVKSLQGTPAYGTVACDSLFSLAREAVRNPNRDFFLRMTSFSLGLAAEQDSWREKRHRLLEEIPWIDAGILDLRDKDTFKRSYAAAINVVLPLFDLVIIDEGHNLKHGLSESTAARNHLLSIVLGTQPPPFALRPKGYGRRFERVLFLSATPLEDDFRQLWNQLEVVGCGEAWQQLRDPEASDEQKEQQARRFLVRRLTGLTLGGVRVTKNRYRREWRNGGIALHDDPLPVNDDRQRLIVALIQKKVAEVLQDTRFNNSFQIGMLASFESFLETARVKCSTGDEEASFDDPSQAVDQLEKDGVDTVSVDGIAKTYYREFGSALPHPKMDAVAESLRRTFDSGEKYLVFVRRVRSVDELQDKLERAYDAWLKDYLVAGLPQAMHTEFLASFKSYEASRHARGPVSVAGEQAGGDNAEDEGDSRTFFGWFFRGRGPVGVFSGAAFDRNRLSSEGSAYSTFFEENYVTRLLGEHTDVVSVLAASVGQPVPEFKLELRHLANQIFRSSSRQARFPKLRVFRAYQQAAVKVLSSLSLDPELKKMSKIIFQERFLTTPEASVRTDPDFPHPDDILSERTFFSELSKRPELERSLLPEEPALDPVLRFRRREQRRELLSTVVRLGRPFIDLWLLAAARLGTLAGRAQERTESRSYDLISEFLQLLESQRSGEASGHTAFRELANVAAHFDLIVAVNFPALRETRLPELPKLFGPALSRQSPIGGMYGGVNRTLVIQFRMPGYPIVLITTDVLQEGEDLHTFCAHVVHYGLAWTPSSLEQRTGRIDRIDSLTHRRLDHKDSWAQDELLQVYYPHLQESVERLQAERVYARVNRFVRLLHRTLAADSRTSSRINVGQELLAPPRDIAPINEILESPFDVNRELLHENEPERALGDICNIANVEKHFTQMVEYLESVFEVERDSLASWRYLATYFVAPDATLVPHGSDAMRARKQPVTLFLHSAGAGALVLRCISPIGQVPTSDFNSIERIGKEQERIGFVKICAVEDVLDRSYNLSVETDIFFSADSTQPEEICDLVSRTVMHADWMEKVLLKVDAAIGRFRSDLEEEPLHE